MLKYVVYSQINKMLIINIKYIKCTLYKKRKFFFIFCEELVSRSMEKCNTISKKKDQYKL